MKRSVLIFLHLLITAIGTTALWWFVFRDRPAEAIADGVTAAAVAGWVEIIVMRRG